MIKYKKNKEKMSSLNIFLYKYIYFNKPLFIIEIFGFQLFVLLYILCGEKIVKNIFGEDHFISLSIIFLVLGMSIIFFALGLVGKLIYMRKKIKCSKCKKIFRADIVFCPKCGNRLDGWDENLTVFKTGNITLFKYTMILVILTIILATIIPEIIKWMSAIK